MLQFSQQILLLCCSYCLAGVFVSVLQQGILTLFWSMCRRMLLAISRKIKQVYCYLLVVLHQLFFQYLGPQIFLIPLSFLQIPENFTFILKRIIQTCNFQYFGQQDFEGVWGIYLVGWLCGLFFCVCVWFVFFFQLCFFVCLFALLLCGGFVWGVFFLGWFWYYFFLKKDVGQANKFPRIAFCVFLLRTFSQNK